MFPSKEVEIGFAKSAVINEIIGYPHWGLKKVVLGVLVLYHHASNHVWAVNHVLSFLSLAGHPPLPVSWRYHCSSSWFPFLLLRFRHLVLLRWYGRLPLLRAWVFPLVAISSSPFKPNRVCLGWLWVCQVSTTIEINHLLGLLLLEESHSAFAFAALWRLAAHYLLDTIA